MADLREQFLVTEYEKLWEYFSQLYRERREAVRFMITALPGIPAVFFAGVRILGADIEVGDVDLWMACLLLVLHAVGWFYFLAFIVMRQHAVWYRREITCRAARLRELAEEPKAAAPKANTDPYPSYFNRGVDFRYGQVMSLVNAAVGGAALHFVGRALALLSPPNVVTRFASRQVPVVSAAAPLVVTAVLFFAMQHMYRARLRAKDCEPTCEDGLGGKV